MRLSALPGHFCLQYTDVQSGTFDCLEPYSSVAIRNTDPTRQQVRPLIDDRFAAKAREALSEGKKPYSMLLSRIEIMMWEFMWSSDDYWNARRHFVFAQELYDEARRFMQSVHIDDGKYMAIHMRCVYGASVVRSGASVALLLHAQQ